MVAGLGVTLFLARVPPRPTARSNWPGEVTGRAGDGGPGPEPAAGRR